MRAEFLAETVAQVITSTVGPILTRINAIEQAYTKADSLRDAMVDGLRERVQLLEGISQRECGSIRERLAVVESREPAPGPPGPPGPAGADGKDGTPGLRYCGVYVDGKSYDLGDGVTWAGSLWHCNAPTTSRPGEASKIWTLMVKRGRDGKDANGPR